MFNILPIDVPRRLTGKLALRKSEKTKIGLICELTNGNLGNAAFEAAAIQHLLAYFPKAQLYVSSINSLDTFRAEGVRLFPLNPAALALTGAPSGTNPTEGRASVHAGLWDRLRRQPLVEPGLRGLQFLATLGREIAFWARSFRFLSDFRLLILCGGGQLSDWWGGPWAHPYRLFMWMLLARLTRTELIAMNVAVERVDAPLSRWFLAYVLRHAHYRSFRDDKSVNAIEQWGVTGESRVYPDLAFSLALPDAAARKSADRTTRVVGVSPMPYCDPRFWPTKDAAAYRRYLETLATFTRHLMAQGYSVILLASQIRMDVNAMRDLRQLILDGDQSLESRILEPPVRNVDDFLALMPGIDLLVASRMHGLLLAQLTHTPALAISYDDKVDSLMAGLGLSEYCLDIRTIDVPRLIERFQSLNAQRALITERLRSRVAEYRDALEGQYKQVFGSLR